MTYTNKQIRELFGHNGVECKVRIPNDKSKQVTRFGSPDTCNRALDFWVDLGTVEDIKRALDFWVDLGTVEDIKTDMTQSKKV